MRIIAGKFRGRRLKSPRGSDVRPTSDRLRETLFDILGGSVADAVVLDVFAGTGAVGLEALSRGARAAVFVESAPEEARLIRENLALCGARSGCRIIRSDVFRALRGLGREGFRADFVFLDPPYRWQPYRDLLGIVFGDEIAAPGACVVLEHHRKAEPPDEDEDYHRARIVRQGDSCLSFYEPNRGRAPCAAAPGE